MSVLDIPVPDPAGGSPSYGGIRWTMDSGTDLKLLDAQTGEVKRKVKGGLQRFGGGLYFRSRGIDRLRQASFSPDGQFVAVGTPKEVKVWDTQTGREVRTLEKFKGILGAIAFSAD